MKNTLLIVCLFSLGSIGCINKSQTSINKNQLPVNSNVTVEERKLHLGDFKQVCNGGKLDNAVGYDKTPNATSPVSVYFQSDSDKPFQEDYFTDYPKDWFIDYTNAEKTQLVACITVSEKKEARKCPYKIDEKTYQLTMNDEKYNVKVYEAKTGTVLAEKDLYLKADKGCPEIMMFTNLEETQDPDYKQPVINFLKPLIKH